HGLRPTVSLLFLIKQGSTHVDERYYLYILLNVICGAQSFEHLCTVNGIEHVTFKNVYQAMGLLQDDLELDQCLKEASMIQTKQQLQYLFVIILINCHPTKPENLWKNHKIALCNDILYQAQQQTQNPVLQLSRDNIENQTLCLLNDILKKWEKTLNDFPNMPVPTMYNNVSNSLIAKKLNYDQLALTKKIALAVASSGIAALLLNNGQTVHSRFKISIKLNEDSICNISVQSNLAELLKQMILIIWDEASMMYRYVFEAIDILCITL
ncbi:11681_t:CDS:2, partial [Acaulospora morrowiae]